MPFGLDNMFQNSRPFAVVVDASRPQSIVLVYLLKVIYQHLYSMNNFVTNKSKLPQDGAQVSPYMG